jgi:hypothetical protein
MKKQVITALALMVVVSSGMAVAETGVATSSTFSFQTMEMSPVEVGSQLPAPAGLGAIFPNPFNPRVTIKYHLAGKESFELSIFDLKGRRVRKLATSPAPEAGTREVVWDGRDDRGRALPGGVYLCRFKAGRVVDNQRMTLVR